MTGDLNATFEHRPIYTPRHFYVFMRRTTISNFSFKRSFQTESKGSTSKGLTQSLIPNHQSQVTSHKSLVPSP